MKQSELRQIIRNILNEENLGQIEYMNKFSSEWEEVDVYKNPKYIKKFKDNVRGCITKDGDLYIVDNQNIIHENIVSILKHRFEVKDIVVSVKKTNDNEIKYLDFDEFDIEKFRQKNPNISIKQL